MGNFKEPAFYQALFFFIPSASYEIPCYIAWSFVYKNINTAY
jgi:hypothetical protein